MILIPEEKQCHSLLSKVMRKNGVAVLSLVEEKYRLLLCRKHNGLDVIWLVNFLCLSPYYFNYTEASFLSPFNFAKLTQFLLEDRIKFLKMNFREQSEGGQFSYLHSLLH